MIDRGRGRADSGVVAIPARAGETMGIAARLRTWLSREDPERAERRRQRKLRAAAMHQRMGRAEPHITVTDQGSPPTPERYEGRH